MEIVKIIVIIVLAGLTILLLARERARQIEREELAKKNMSFMESLNLTGLPIVTFSNNGKMLNFVLDTGSNVCIVNSEVLTGLDYETVNKHTGIVGVSGDTNEEGEVVCLLVSYKGRTYEVECYSSNMSDAVNSIKKEYGVTIHGILGTGFFTTYKYILDFNELVAYSLKKP